MRALRWMLVVAVAGSVLGIPTGAVANGGAYIRFDETYYVPGDPAVGDATGSATLFIPLAKQGLLERGPFHAFVLPMGTSIREGRPIPAGAIRVGTYTIEKTKSDQFELRVSFAVPELPRGSYSIALCNDPCTISGFREPLSGSIFVVHTAYEAELLVEQARLEAVVGGLRRQVRRAERQLEELHTQSGATEGERSRLVSEVNRLEGEVNRLEGELADARAATGAEQPAPRPLIDPWAAAGIGAALVGLAGAALFRRRRPARIEVPDTIDVPDTIEELEPEMEDPAKR